MRIELSDPLFKDAIPILNQIESHGYEAYFVGGCVRDTLLNIQIHDIDIASSALPEEIEEIFPRTFDVGKEHGTIVVLERGEPYEITTFRTEGKYSDHRHPDEVNFVRNLEEDTLRRDLTINAMAFDRNGQLYDYHGGLKDLQAGIIRCVGNAKERFEEDALRMMRAIRFASELGFNIESSTFEAIQELHEDIEHVAMERIRVEFDKYLLGDYFRKNYHFLVESNLSNYLYGFTDIDGLEVLTKLSNDLEKIKALPISKDLRFVWARLLSHMKIVENKKVKKFVKYWTHSNSFARDVAELVELLYILGHYPINEWISYIYDEELLNMVESFYLEIGKLNQPQFGQIRDQLSILSKKELVINGKDLMTKLEISKGGPIIGKILDQIEYLVVMGKLSNDTQSINQYIEHLL